MIYHEDIPWWLLVYISEATFTLSPTGTGTVTGTGIGFGYQNATDADADAETHEPFTAFSTSYTPAIARQRPTTLEFLIDLPPKRTLNIRLPFEKQFIKYDEHPPDAHRGFDISPALLWIVPAWRLDGDYKNNMNDTNANKTVNNILLLLSTPIADLSPCSLLSSLPRRSRLYSTRLLIDLPTPDFSMPYNVIIMSSTLIALFFGSVVNLLVRRLGVVRIPEEGEVEDSAVGEKEKEEEMEMEMEMRTNRS